MSIIGRFFSSGQTVELQTAEAKATTFVVAVTINSTRDKAPSLRLRRLGLPRTPHAEIKVNLVRPFDGVISGNSTGRGDLAFFSVGWPAGHPIPEEVEVREAWIAGPRVPRARNGRARTSGMGAQSERSENSEPPGVDGPSEPTEPAS